MSSLRPRIQNQLTAAHVRLYRISGGRLGQRFHGAPVMLLEHVGRKSGTHRTSPLIYSREGDDVLLIASNGGDARHPAWFHNLKAAGKARVTVGPESWDVTVRVTDEPERTRLWQKMTAVYPPYDEYQERAERQIPLVVLSRSDPR
jgi:deazaflavin-dependent oxidoreductase (nitroreductase family)